MCARCAFVLEPFYEIVSYFFTLPLELSHQTAVAVCQKNERENLVLGLVLVQVYKY